MNKKAKCDAFDEGWARPSRRWWFSSGRSKAALMVLEFSLSMFLAAWAAPIKCSALTKIGSRLCSLWATCSICEKDSPWRLVRNWGRESRGSSAVISWQRERRYTTERILYPNPSRGWVLGLGTGGGIKAG